MIISYYAGINQAYSRYSLMSLLAPLVKPCLKKNIGETSVCRRILNMRAVCAVRPPYPPVGMPPPGSIFQMPVLPKKAFLNGSLNQWVQQGNEGNDHNVNA